MKTFNNRYIKFSNKLEIASQRKIIFALMQIKHLLLYTIFLNVNMSCLFLTIILNNLLAIHRLEPNFFWYTSPSHSPYFSIVHSFFYSLENLNFTHTVYGLLKILCNNNIYIHIMNKKNISAFVSLFMLTESNKYKSCEPNHLTKFETFIIFSLVVSMKIETKIFFQQPKQKNY